MVRMPISQGTASVRESLAEDRQQAPHISRAVPLGAAAQHRFGRGRGAGSLAVDHCLTKRHSPTPAPPT